MVSSFRGDENVMELDSGDDCKMQNAKIQNAKMSTFYGI